MHADGGFPCDELGGARLPDGFAVRLRADVRVADGGRMLVGGSPLRAIRLTDRALPLLDDDKVQVKDQPSRLLAARLLDANLADPVLTDVVPHTEDLTVVIPVRDRPEQLDRCLAALRPLRCVVVDDASHDPKAVAEVAARHGAHVVALPVNVGPAGARNAGLRYVATPYVAFVDSDVQVGADTLARLARHFHDPGVALVGPIVRAVPAPRSHGGSSGTTHRRRRSPSDSEPARSDRALPSLGSRAPAW